MEMKQGDKVYSENSGCCVFRGDVFLCFIEFLISLPFSILQQWFSQIVVERKTVVDVIK